MRELTGIQILPLNTVYQLHADTAAGRPESDAQWINLPEYLLSHWGGGRVAEYTNATHTGMVELYKKQWCREIFSALHLDLADAPRSEEHTSELQSLRHLVCRLLLEENKQLQSWAGPPTQSDFGAWSSAVAQRS